MNENDCGDICTVYFDTLSNNVYAYSFGFNIAGICVGSIKGIEPWALFK